MRRALLAFFMVSITLLVVTFAGTAFFGMGPGMAMDHGTGMECVDHCLSVMPVSSSATSLPLTIFAAGLLGFFLYKRLTEASRFVRFRHRRRSGIGKFLLHQNLSTIVLRN